jgi:hypothetical protein
MHNDVVTVNEYVELLPKMLCKAKALEEIKQRNMIMAGGQIDMRKVMSYFLVKPKNYVPRIASALERMNIDPYDMPYEIIRRQKHFLLPDDIALQIITDTAKRLMVHERGINDVRLSDGRGYVFKAAYKPWLSMFERSYSESWHRSKPWYSKVEVSKEWFLYSNFLNWYERNSLAEPMRCRKERYFVNKDVFEQNVIYGPDTCFIIPEHIHQLISNMPRPSGEMPIGVRKSKQLLGMYEARIKYKGKVRTYGSYSTIREAVAVYRMAKWRLVLNVVEEDYAKGKVTQDFLMACRARCNREVARAR